MMFGVVSENCEAIVKVTIGPADGPKVTIDADNRSDSRMS